MLNADQRDVWLIDSGASQYITNQREWFRDFHTTSDGATVTFGGDDVCTVVGQRTVFVNTYIQGQWYELRLENLLYVSLMKNNSLSVGAKTSKGFKVSFKDDMCFIERGADPIAIGIKQKNGVFRLVSQVVSKKQINTEADISTANLQVWHER